MYNKRLKILSICEDFVYKLLQNVVSCAIFILEYCLKNYYKLQSPSFFKFQYVFLDSEDYLADQLFIKYKVTVDFGDEYVKENSPYHVIFCKIRKRDEKKFLDALSEMYDKMLLMGYKDYQEVCDNFIRVVEKNEKEK